MTYPAHLLPLSSHILTPQVFIIVGVSWFIYAFAARVFDGRNYVQPLWLLMYTWITGFMITVPVTAGLSLAVGSGFPFEAQEPYVYVFLYLGPIVWIATHVGLYVRRKMGWRTVPGSALDRHERRMHDGNV